MYSVDQVANVFAPMTPAVVIVAVIGLTLAVSPVFSLPVRVFGPVVVSTLPYAPSHWRVFSALERFL